MEKDTAEKKLLKWAAQMQSIAQNGLAYSQGVYDIERYHELMTLAETMMAECSGAGLDVVKNAFKMQSGYATPKIDVRGFILKENKLLLVRERQDNCWTLPGGWSEVNLSPSENMVKEIKEETGARSRDVVRTQKKRCMQKLKTVTIELMKAA